MHISRQNIENRGTLRDRVFNCSGYLGYPPGHLEIQTNFGGNFTTILSRANLDIELGFVTGSAATVSAECDAYDYLEFAFRETAMTLENNDKRLRCVIVPAPELPEQASVYDEDVLKILSGM